jgi:hypothetical protein
VDKIITALSDLIALLYKNNINVMFFEMLPRKPSHLGACFFKHNSYSKFNSLNKCKLSPLNFYYDEQVLIYKVLKSRFDSKLTMISMVDLMCENSQCKSYLDNMPLYRDNTHLNIEGSRLLGKKYMEQNSND